MEGGRVPSYCLIGIRLEGNKEEEERWGGWAHWVFSEGSLSEGDERFLTRSWVVDGATDGNGDHADSEPLGFWMIGAWLQL
ncbi:hypothetical protein TIFTF001_012321 [Ficus carica]|uniref:Uncharacterized protein n=1 Tax=Ficus carica TaxID=3494 RepID=A0AA88D3K7_FICCA|nr:hypothetical protein TIFTF001_012321 [Ficus carica]